MRSLALLATILAVLCASAGCAPRASAGRGALLVIAVDELRADHTSVLGYDRDTTPRLAAFAAEGSLFTRAFSTAPWSVPAHLSLLTGCDPGVCKRYLPPGATQSAVLRWRLPAAAPALAEEMLRAGFSTAAFVDDPLIGPALGFARGFQTFDMLEAREARGPEDWGARGVLGRLDKWLAGRDQGEAWFAYVQLSDLQRAWDASDPQWDRRFEPRAELALAPPVLDTHHAYFGVPRRRWSGAWATLGDYEARYDGAVARLDLELGRFLDKLRTRRDFEQLTIVVVATHGLSFGESGLYVDSGGVSEADLRSLCIVRPAARFASAPRGARIDSAASLMDLAPTLLELHEAEIPPAMQGLSWKAALAGGAPPAGREGRTVYARFGRQDGFLAAEADLSYSIARPWLSEPPHLARAWYGGPLPAQPQPVEALMLRAADGRVLESALAAFDPQRLEALRSGAQAWFDKVEAVRQAFHPAEWAAFER